MIIFFSSCDRIQDSSISYDELAVSYNLKKVVLRSVLLWYREGEVSDPSFLEEVKISAIVWKWWIYISITIVVFHLDRN